MRNWIKKLLCPHLVWTNNLLDRRIDQATPFILRKVGHQNYRTNENYWLCLKCLTLKNFKWNNTGPNIPINFR